MVCLMLGVAGYNPLTSAANQPPQQFYDINLPSLNAAEALNLLAKQTGATFLFPYDIAKTRQANPVVGSYSLMDALELLLQDSGLSVGLSEKGVLMISLAESETLNDLGEDKMNAKKSVLATVIAFFVSSQALAEEGSDVLGSQYALEEITVTARKRGDQSIQDIAGSIQALGSEALKKSVAQGFSDYARMVPSLQMMDSGSGQTQISMRGIFSTRINPVEPQSRSTAAIYFDELAITNAGFNPDVGLVDIDRVEVLRGPQGTLYGASSMAGAIRIIPKKPDLEEFTGELSANISDTKDGSENYGITGAVNIPVSDNFAFRVAGYSNDKGGFIDNVATREDDYNDEKNFGARIIAHWDATDTLSIQPMFLYHKLESDGRAQEFIKGDPAVNTLQTGGGSISMVGPGEDISQFTITDELQTSKLVDDPFEDEFSIFSLTIEKEFDWGNLTSVTGYMERDIENEIDDVIRLRATSGTGGFNAATGEALLAFSPLISELENFSQEIRISSSSDSEIEWVAGIYYEDQERIFDQDSYVPGFEAHWNAFGIPGFPGLSEVYGADVDQQFQGDQDIETDQIAIFGELVYPLTDRLKVTAGLRWYDYEQTVNSLTFRGIPNGGITQLNNVETSEDGVNPKVAVSYDLNDTSMVYASAARGFRLGSINEPVPTEDIFFPGFSCAAAPGADPATDGVVTLEDLGFSTDNAELDPVESDTVDSYEIGGKFEYFDGRARTNLALFYTEWDDIPTKVTMTCGYTIILNASTVVSQGFELENSFQVTEALRIGMNMAYTNSELDDDSPFLGADKGAGSPFTPEWNINGNFDYSLPTSFLGASEWYLSGNLSYVSKQFSAFAEVPPSELKIELPSTVVANLYLGLVADSWEFSVYAKNLTDERILTAVDFSRRQPVTFTRARPREIGANFRYRF